MTSDRYFWTSDDLIEGAGREGSPERGHFERSNTTFDAEIEGEVLRKGEVENKNVNSLFRTLKVAPSTER